MIKVGGLKSFFNECETFFLSNFEACLSKTHVYYNLGHLGRLVENLFDDMLQKKVNKNP